MTTIFLRYEDDTMQYQCNDYDGSNYGVVDTCENGTVVDTLVVDMKTYQEVQDSELFKRIVTSRAAFVNDNADIRRAILEFSQYK